MTPELESALYVPDECSPEEAIARTTHLAIGAHQDDLEIFAYHGIESCFDGSDAWFGGVTLTDGAGSARTGPYQDVSDAQMQAVRHQEQNEAARLGHYAFQVQLRTPSSVLKDRRAAAPVVDRLEEVLRLAKPHTLYLHNPADKHDTHIASLRRALEALQRLDPGDRPVEVFGCEVWRDLDWLADSAKIALPIGRRPELERALLAVFRSQLEGGKDYVAAALGRRRANATFFQSHSVDNAPALTFAMDLAPLLQCDGPTLAELVDEHLRSFQEDVAARLARF